MKPPPVDPDPIVRDAIVLAWTAKMGGETKSGVEKVVRQATAAPAPRKAKEPLVRLPMETIPGTRRTRLGSHHPPAAQAVAAAPKKRKTRRMRSGVLGSLGIRVSEEANGAVVDGVAEAWFSVNKGKLKPPKPPNEGDLAVASRGVCCGIGRKAVRGELLADIELAKVRDGVVLGRGRELHL